MKKISYLFGLLLIMMSGCTTSDDGIEYKEGDNGEAEGVIEWMHEKLVETYLYNDEYEALSPKDYTLDYDDFLSYHLLQLTGNTYDKKTYPSEYGGGTYIFSYVEREETGASSSATRATTTAVSYGFVALTAYKIDDNIVITVDGVYNSSPATEKSVGRGAVITKYNGTDITTSNYSTVLSNLYYPTSGTTVSLTLSGGSTVSLTAKSVFTNPVLMSTKYGASNNIGYLNYASFDYNFDSQLKDAISDLSGVEHLILDLRLNLGGYVSSANLLTAMISSNTDSKQVFQYYEFNEDIMSSKSSSGYSWFSLPFDSSKGYYYETLDVPTNTLGMTNKTVYCLVSYNTASASEMVINALRGMGYTVVLIGETTRGKNVGMYGLNDYSDGNYKYTLWAINFINHNCECWGDYADGFDPDYEIDDHGSATSNFPDFSDFSKDEKLISTAISLIDGTYTAPRAVATRSGDTTTKMTTLLSPSLKSGARKESNNTN